MAAPVGWVAIITAPNSKFGPSTDPQPTALDKPQSVSIQHKAAQPLFTSLPSSHRVARPTHSFNSTPGLCLLALRRITLIQIIYSVICFGLRSSLMKRNSLASIYSIPRRAPILVESDTLASLCSYAGQRLHVKRRSCLHALPRNISCNALTSQSVC
jgi:hypothetical protein